MIEEKQEEMQEEVLENNQSSYDDSTTEGESSSERESGEPETTTFTQEDIDRAIEERDKRWKDRYKEYKLELKDEGKEGGKGRQEGSSETNEEVLERLNRADLRAEGIKDKKEQDAVMELAAALKLDVVEALERPAVKAELKALRDKKSTPAPSKRTSAGERADDVDYLVRQYRAGKLLKPAEFRKVQRHLRGER